MAAVVVSAVYYTNKDNDIDNHTAEITFELSQRALASGQVLALYEDEKLLGGGFYL